MPISRAAHKVYEIKYHIVICVKYRKKLLLPDDRIAFLKWILSEIEQRYDMEFDTVGTDGDHMHLFVDAATRSGFFPGGGRRPDAFARPGAQWFAH